MRSTHTIDTNSRHCSFMFTMTEVNEFRCSDMAHYHRHLKRKATNLEVRINVAVLGRTLNSILSWRAGVGVILQKWIFCRYIFLGLQFQWVDEDCRHMFDFFYLADWWPGTKANWASKKQDVPLFIQFEFQLESNVFCSAFCVVDRAFKSKYKLTPIFAFQALSGVEIDTCSSPCS